MTDDNYGAVALLVDRSGSMNTIREATEGAINEFIHAQGASDKRITVRLDQFDGEFATVWPSTPALDCPVYALNPRGVTALHDAIGKSVTEFGEELAALPEEQRPSKVIFAIMTDGFENASSEWTVGAVKELITRQTEQYGWEFVFLAANQDAVLTGEGLGIARDRSLTYNTSRAGTKSAVRSFERYTASSLAGGQSAFTDEDRAESVQEDAD